MFVEITRGKPNDDEQHDAFGERLIQRGRVARKVFPLTGAAAVDRANRLRAARIDETEHRIGRATGKLRVREVAESAEAEPDRNEWRGEVAHFQKRTPDATPEPEERDQHTDQAAVERHPAVPDPEQPQRIGEKLFEPVEEEGPHASAEH